MTIKKILAAAAAATVLSLAGASAADAASLYVGIGHGGLGYHDRGRVERVERRIVDHRVIFDNFRARHIRYAGTPYFVRGHYVMRSFDRFNRVTFIEVNPYTGRIVGVIRL